MAIGQFLKFVGYLAVMLCVIPLTGLCVTGSWRGAWQYCVVWGRSIGIILALAAALWLVTQAFMP